KHRPVPAGAEALRRGIDGAAGRTIHLRLSRAERRCPARSGACPGRGQTARQGGAALAAATPRSSRGRAGRRRQEAVGGTEEELISSANPQRKQGAPLLALGARAPEEGDPIMTTLRRLLCCLGLAVGITILCWPVRQAQAYVEAPHS